MTKAELRKIEKLTYLTKTGDKAKEKVMRTQIGVMATKIKTMATKIQLLKIQMEDLEQKKAATIAKANEAINERKFFIEHTMEEHKEDLAELLAKQDAENNNMTAKEVAAEIDTEPQKVVDAFTRAAAEDATAMFSAPSDPEPTKNAKISPVSSSGKESSGEAHKTQNTTPKQPQNEGSDTDVVSPAAKERDIQESVSAETAKSTRTPENGKNKAVSGSGKESSGEPSTTQESTPKSTKNDGSRNQDPDDDPFSWLDNL